MHCGKLMSLATMHIIETVFERNCIATSLLSCRRSRTDAALKQNVLSVVFACMLILTQLLFQQNALVFIKSTRYYNLYFLSLYS
jgi:hypothetical protein